MFLGAAASVKSVDSPAGEEKKGVRHCKTTRERKIPGKEAGGEERWAAGVWPEMTKVG